MSGKETVVLKDMGITHAEFLRLLPRVLGDTPYVFDGTEITVQDGVRALAIRLGAESERRIALMRIATTSVTLTFTGYDDASREDFLTRFDRAYQRGGG